MEGPLTEQISKTLSFRKIVVARLRKMFCGVRSLERVRLGGMVGFVGGWFVVRMWEGWRDGVTTG